MKSNTDQDGNTGIGEVAPIERLSPDEIEEIPAQIEKFASKLSSVIAPSTREEVYGLVSSLVKGSFSSLKFGLEMCLLDLIGGGKKEIFSNNLPSIELPINGLVWMGDEDFMRNQIKEKLDEGFSCIKLKIGSLDFDTELKILRDLRSISDDIIIRLDANGAFQVNEVLLKLRKLSEFNIHSIEQPILPMQPEALEMVCIKSEIPIALDEELIWVSREKERLQLLQEIKPHYLVLKPTLHGGFASVENWIDLAGIQGIDWWITSYLESNLGLNAIAQFASLYPNTNHHGLSTGSLYSNNIISPIHIVEGQLTYADSATWGDVSFQNS